MSNQRYTHTPNLHHNLLISSFQLLVWLLWHPSAWRTYVARNYPHLSPDFTWLDVTLTDFKQPPMQRLLVQSYLILPAVTILSSSLLLAYNNASIIPIINTVAYIVAIELTLTLLVGLVVSVCAGVINGISIVIAAGIIAIIELPASWLPNVAVGFSAGLTGFIAHRFADNRPVESSTRHTTGIAIGLLVGVIIIWVIRYGLTEFGHLMVGIPENSAYNLARSIVVGGSFTIASGFKTSPKTAGFLGIFTALLYISSVTGAQMDEPIIILQGFCGGLLFGVSLGTTVVFPFILAEYIAGSSAGAWASALGSWGRHVVRNQVPLWPAYPLGLMAILLGLTFTRWWGLLSSPLWALWGQILYRLDQRQPEPTWFSWHPAFWDELNHHPMSGLEKHLLLLVERNPIEGQRALTFLNLSPQRWAAQAVQIELEARQLESCQTIQAISQVHQTLATGDLVGQANALLRNFSHISQDVSAALNQTSAYTQRLALSTIDDRLNNFGRELTVSSEPYAIRFHPVAVRWQQIVMLYLQTLVETVERNQEIDNPYIVGVPLTDQQDIFVGRTDIVARIEQLLLDRRRPPLLLYGQRRMGKTSLLRNLGRLLPQTIIPMFVDGQRIALAEDNSDLLYNMAREMTRSAKKQRSITLPHLSLETLQAHPFTCFNEWLDAVEETLEAHGERMALLTLDEFEMLETAFEKGKFEETDVFSLLRNIIQHRPRFKVMLAGSHTLNEFQRWASYLINVQVIKIGYLSEAETRQLVEQPVKDFSLRYEPSAVEQVITLTRGHPAMVQLLCYEIVTLKNEQSASQRRLATVADVELAVQEALTSGSFFFADIQQNQIDQTGEEILRFMAQQDESAVVSRETLRQQLVDDTKLDKALHHLCQRDLLELKGDGYRFQVALIQRWFMNV